LLRRQREVLEDRSERVLQRTRHLLTESDSGLLHDPPELLRKWSRRMLRCRRELLSTGLGCVLRSLAAVL
jgi:hypothetical protein